MATGWSYEYTEEHMDLPRLTEFLGVWKTTPPAHETLRVILGVLGVEAPHEAEPPATEEGEGGEGAVEEIISFFGGPGVEVVRTKDGG